MFLYRDSSQMTSIMVKDTPKLSTFIVHFNLLAWLKQNYSCFQAKNMSIIRVHSVRCIYGLKYSKLYLGQPENEEGVTKLLSSRNLFRQYLVQGFLQICVTRQHTISKVRFLSIKQMLTKCLENTVHTKYKVSQQVWDTVRYVF